MRHCPGTVWFFFFLRLVNSSLTKQHLLKVVFSTPPPFLAPYLLWVSSAFKSSVPTRPCTCSKLAPQFQQLWAPESHLKVLAAGATFAFRSPPLCHQQIIRKAIPGEGLLSARPGLSGFYFFSSFFTITHEVLLSSFCGWIQVNTLPTAKIIKIWKFFYLEFRNHTFLSFCKNFKQSCTRSNVVV